MRNRAISFVAILAALSSCTDCPYDWNSSTGSLIGSDGKEILNISCDLSDGLTASCDADLTKDGTLQVEWKFTAQQDVDDARINVDVKVPSRADWWMMPAVSYNGNHWGTGGDPKGAADGDNGWWTYSYRRSPIPGAVYSENADYAVASWCDVPRGADDDFSYSIMPEEGKTTHRYIWPEEEMPRAYVSRDRFSDGWRKESSMKKGQTHTLKMYISVDASEPGHRAVSHFMKKAWSMAEKVEFGIPDDPQLWNYALRFVKESLWDPSDECIGFRTGLLPEYGCEHPWITEYGDSYPPEPGQERRWRKAQGYAGGWVGRNIYIGCALLADFILNGDRESLEMGLATLDHWAENAPCASGLLRSGLPGGGVDACQMGTEMLAFMDACRLAGKCGLERPQYMKVALDACDAAIATQREDGCYARNWSADEAGAPLSYDGFTSVYVISPMLMAYKETGDTRYMESATRAFAYFMGEFDRCGFTTAGALDTNCIDKESSIPLFAAAIQLYEMLGERRYLDDALALGYYVSGWLWHYDGVYPADDSFSRCGFHTFGGTSVSTQHQCLDNFGLKCVNEMRRLSQLTGDSQWAEKADAMYRFSCQLISDGELQMNGRIRPVGGQSEAYFQAQWCLYGNLGRFDNWLVAWPSVMRLEYQMQKLGLLKFRK